MKKAKIAIGILLVFIFGSLVGSLGTGVFYEHGLERLDEARQHMDRKGRLLERLTRELELTATQQVEIAEIIEQRQKELQEFKKLHRPEMEEMRARQHQRIRERLDGEQQEKLDRIMKRLDGRRRPGQP